jgi:hypothetical protein
MAEKSILAQEQETLLITTQQFTDLSKINRTFKIYVDSSYVCTEIINEANHNKKESWTGKAHINNDTIRFFPFRLNYNRSETGILKNGFIEFINGEYPEKMKIASTSLNVKNHIDFKNFKDYSVFTFNPGANNLPARKNLINYDLTSKDLNKINILLQQTFSQHSELRKFQDYIKQIEAVKNFNNDIVLFIYCFCKRKHLLESYEFYLTSMNDGGNCNVYIQLNLTTGKIETLNIAGR